MIEHKQILIREAAMAKLLGISVPYIIKLRRLRKIPYFKIGKSVRYNPHEVEKALEKFTVAEEI
jgi:excisionase family DNA binding protein